MLPKNPDFPGDEPATSPALLRRREHMLRGDAIRSREPHLVSPDDGEPYPDLESSADDEFDPEIPPPPIAATPVTAIAAAEPVDPSARRPKAWLVAAAALPVIALGAVTWIVYDAVMGEPSGGAVPYIMAEPGPEKVRPQQEGGLEVPNQDIRVYNELNGSPALPEAEVLLPAPEIPVTPPVVGGLQPQPPALADQTPEESASEPDVDPATGSGTQPTEAVTAEASNGEPESSAASASSAEHAAGGQSTQGAAGAEAFRIQLIAVKNREAARAAWKTMTKAHPGVLGELAPNIVKVDRGADGVLYRVQGGPFADRAAAESACGKLKQESQDCLVVAP